MRSQHAPRLHMTPGTCPLVFKHSHQHRSVDRHSGPAATILAMVAADPGYHSQVDIWFEVKKFSFSLEIFVSFNRASHDLGRTS